MSSKFSPNVALRRFPSGSDYADTLRGARGARLGSPYKALDRWSVALMWLMYLALGVSLAITGSTVTLPWLFVLGPASIAFVCLMGKMINRVWFLRILAALHAGCCMLSIFHLPWAS